MNSIPIADYRARLAVLYARWFADVRTVPVVLPNRVP